MDSAATLVAGLKGGEARSQQAFWDRYWPEVYAICAHILGGGADATDTAVDLLTDFMVDYVNRLSHPRALRSYLRLMAVRRSLRRREKRSVMEYVDIERLGDDEAIDPEEAAGYAVLAPRLAHCLDELTPKAQQVVRLKYGQQMANARIGEILGGSKQYIGRVIHRSLKTLRECVERGGAGSNREGGWRS